MNLAGDSRINHPVPQHHILDECADGTR